MNKKIWILVAGIVLAGLILLLTVFRPLDNSAAIKEENVVAQEGGSGDTEEDPGAQLVENQGDLIIVIPEDEESDGF